MYTLVSVRGWGSRRESFLSEDEGKEGVEWSSIIERLGEAQRGHERVDKLRMAQQCPLL